VVCPVREEEGGGQKPRDRPRQARQTRQAIRLPVQLEPRPVGSQIDIRAGTVYAQPVRSERKDLAAPVVRGCQSLRGHVEREEFHTLFESMLKETEGVVEVTVSPPAGRSTDIRAGTVYAQPVRSERKDLAAPVVRGCQSLRGVPSKGGGSSSRATSSAKSSTPCSSRCSKRPRASSKSP
jgi:hypothetical protein